jgi:hypothetical protein
VASSRFCEASGCDTGDLVQPSSLLRSLAAVSALAAVTFASALPAFALSVTVNGQAIALAPPPIERAGRVFVPLRGVFEKLGASVVYEAGVINANGSGRTISLKIGSNQATVNGSAQTVDTPPFIVGATTYVPLRFISEALGAGVNYDATNKLVALTTGQAPVAATVATPLARILRGSAPERDAYVGSTKPTISSNFSQRVDPNSVRITLDGLDISRSATISDSGFIYAPPSPLQSIKHHMAVAGKLAGGQDFSEEWSFTSGGVAPKDTVFLSSPSDGASVPANFTIAGKAVPNARIRIVAGATASLGGAFAFGAGTYTGDTLADGDGNFSQSVSLQTVSGAEIGLTVTATDPQTKESAQKKLRLRAQ